MRDPLETHVEPTACDDLDATHPVVRAVQIGLVVAALAVVTIVLVSHRGADQAADAKGPGRLPLPASTTTTVALDWPAAVGGRPPALGRTGQRAPEVDVAPGTKPGVYLWNDYDGWHLWVIGGRGVSTITGSIQSNDVVDKADLAVPGTGTVSRSGKVASFTFPAGAQLAGIDFHPGFYGRQMVVSLDGPDGPLPVALLHVGRDAADTPFPFVIELGPRA
jgi:hypothetical protein